MSQDEKIRELMDRIESRWRGVRVFERYIIQDCVRLGRHNILMAGWDIEHGQRVAVKLPLRRQELYRRLMRERIALEEIGAVAGPALLGYGEARTRFALILEWLGGATLRQRLAVRGGLPGGEFFEIMTALVNALAHIHARGFAHGNLRSTNVLLTPSPRLVDFGEARHVREPNARACELRAGDVHDLAELFHEAIGGAQATFRPLPETFSDGASVPVMLRALIERCRDTQIERRPDMARVQALFGRLARHALPRERREPSTPTTQEWVQRQGLQEREGSRSLADSIEILPDRPRRQPRRRLHTTPRPAQSRERWAHHLSGHEE